MAHESPIQSWNRMRPSVVSASKSGAVLPICRGVDATWTAMGRSPKEWVRGMSLVKGGSISAPLSPGNDFLYYPLMHQAVPSPLEAWANFYVILGSSAAALTGLQFVVLTL